METLRPLPHQRPPMSRKSTMAASIPIPSATTYGRCTKRAAPATYSTQVTTLKKMPLQARRKFTNGCCRKFETRTATTYDIRTQKTTTNYIRQQFTTRATDSRTELSQSTSRRRQEVTLLEATRRFLL